MPIHTTPKSTKTVTNKLDAMKEEFHAHGDPLLDAMQNYNHGTDRESQHKQELKTVYDKHAELLHEERGAGAVVGDHLWFYNDLLPPQPEDMTKEGA